MKPKRQLFEIKKVGENLLYFRKALKFIDKRVQQHVSFYFKRTEFKKNYRTFKDR